MPALAVPSNDRDLGVLVQRFRALKEDAPAAASLRTALKRGRRTGEDNAAVRNAILYHSVDGVFSTLRAIEVLGPLFVELMTPEPAELEQCQWDSSMLETAWDAVKDGRDPASHASVSVAIKGPMTLPLALLGSLCVLHVSLSRHAVRNAYSETQLVCASSALCYCEKWLRYLQMHMLSPWFSLTQPPQCQDLFARC